jgi:hypothetical protein
MVCGPRTARSAINCCAAGGVAVAGANVAIAGGAPCSRPAVGGCCRARMTNVAADVTSIKASVATPIA